MLKFEDVGKQVQNKTFFSKKKIIVGKTKNIVNLMHLLWWCFLRRYALAFFTYAGCNMILAGTAAAICAYIAPAAAGSGIPEVKAYLNGVDAHSILAPSTLFVKVP